MSFVKTFLKDVSAKARDQLWKLPYVKPGSPSDHIRIFSHPAKHVFFGYFDVTPFSTQGESILAHQTAFNQSSQTPSAVADIGYFDFDSSEFHLLAKTKAWCWQQGSRLQFFNDDSVFFNRAHQNKAEYEGVVYSLKSKESEISFSRALYCLSPDRSMGLSLNFSRLQRLRPGYGYSTFADESRNERAPATDGVWIGDLLKNEFRLLISIQELARLSPSSEAEEAEHYINHLNFSPDGKKFIFFHLWKSKSQKYGRCFWYDLKTSSLKLINIPGNPSHFAWRNSNELLFTYRDRNLKQIGYFLHSLDLDQRTHLTSADLQRDGHPTFLNESVFITDTYPSRTGRQELFKYDMQDNRKTSLGKFYRRSAFNGEFRIDLHPRLNTQRSLVAIDDEHRNFRALKVLTL